MLTIPAVNLSAFLDSIALLNSAQLSVTKSFAIFIAAICSACFDTAVTLSVSNFVSSFGLSSPKTFEKLAWFAETTAD